MSNDAKLTVALIDNLSDQYVKQAANIETDDNDLKRKWATDMLIKQIEIYDDYVPALGAWAGRAMGLKVMDLQIVDQLERWLCEQIIRFAWMRMNIGKYI